MVSDRSPEQILSLAFWDRKIGPFLDADGVQCLSALTADELRLAEQYGDVLSLPSDGGGRLYPSFQFGSRGEFLPGLREVSAILTAVVLDAWDVALWLQTLRDEFQGRPAVDVLRTGLIEPVLVVARLAKVDWKPTRIDIDETSEAVEPVAQAGP